MNAPKFVFLLVITLLAISMSEAAPPGCPGVCPAIFQPVCGKMGSTYKTFSNKCALDAENKCRGAKWTVAKEGSC